MEKWMDFLMQSPFKIHSGNLTILGVALGITNLIIWNAPFWGCSLIKGLLISPKYHDGKAALTGTPNRLG